MLPTVFSFRNYRSLGRSLSVVCMNAVASLQAWLRSGIHLRCCWPDHRGKLGVHLLVLWHTWPKSSHEGAASEISRIARFFNQQVT